VDGAATSAASLARSPFVSPGSHCYPCSLNCAICSIDSLLSRNRSVIGVKLCKGAVSMSLGTNEARSTSEKEPRNTRVGGANDGRGAVVEGEVSKW